MWLFLSSRRRHTRSLCDWSADVCSSDLLPPNCETATEITGMSAEGSRVTASLVKETQPSTRRMIEKTTDGSGLRIDHAEILRAISVPVDRFRPRTWS